MKKCLIHMHRYRAVYPAGYKCRDIHTEMNNAALRVLLYVSRHFFISPPLCGVPERDPP